MRDWFKPYLRFIGVAILLGLLIWSGQERLSAYQLADSSGAVPAGELELDAVNSIEFASISAADNNQLATNHTNSDAIAAARAVNWPAFDSDAALRAAPRVANNVGGVWSDVIDWPHVPIAAAVLPDGRLLTWAAFKRDTFVPFTDQNNTYTAVWDPNNGQFEETIRYGHDMFCAHVVMLEDGRVFANGGNTTLGKVETSLFDFETDQWTFTDSMDNSRWYPTSVYMPNGSVFTALGEGGGQYPELWTESGGWESLNGINLYWPSLSYTGHYEQDWWPLLHLAPDGRLFHSGPTPQMHWIDPLGSETVTPVGEPFESWYPKHGATTMYDKGKLMTVGGASTRFAESGAVTKGFTLDINGETPQLELINDMSYGRMFHNGVMLPTGEIMIVGGNENGIKFSDNDSQLTPEVWNPANGSWRSLNPMSVPRNYHSVALLMPDGRVISAGGGLCGCYADHPDAQLFSPPYLFDDNGNLAPRPDLSAFPARAEAGATLLVNGTPNLSRITMIRMSGTTHAINTDLRFLEVEFDERSAGRYALTLESNLNVLVPGYWMVFGIDGNGVPSEAEILQISSNFSNQAPTVNGLGNRSDFVGESVSFQVEASDPEGENLSYAASDLPPGISIDPSSGLVSGELTTAGTFNPVVTVTDNFEVAAETGFEWIISIPNNQPVLANPGDQRTLLDRSVSLQIEASDPDSDGLTYAAENLPPGLGIDSSTGEISGKATELGEYEVEISVSDGQQTANTSINWIIYGELTVAALTSAPQPVDTAIRYGLTITGGINPTVVWGFGDNSGLVGPLTAFEVEHQFDLPGRYLIEATVSDETGQSATIDFLQAVHLPLAPNAGAASQSILYESTGSNDRLWVVNPDNDTVSVFDTATAAKLAELPVGDQPRSLALAPNGEVWVVNKLSASITVIGGTETAFQVTDTLPLPFASQPHGIVFDPAGQFAYVTLEASDQLAKIELTFGQVVDLLDVGSTPRGVAITGDGQTLLISRFITPLLPGEETAAPQTVVDGLPVGGEIVAVRPALSQLTQPLCCSTTIKSIRSVWGAACLTIWGRSPSRRMARAVGCRPRSTIFCAVWPATACRSLLSIRFAP